MDVISAATLEALAELDPGQATVALLVIPGRTGTFTWLPGDHAAQIAADPLQGVYVKGTAGVQGVWKRTYEGDLSVRWFGAVGDGVHDDTAAIQATLDFASRALHSNYWASYYGSVHLPAGGYSISGLSISSPISLSGAGMLCTTLNLRNGSNRDVLTLQAPSPNMPGNDSFRHTATLCDFSINANGPGQSATSNGIHIENSNVPMTTRYDGSVVLERITIRAARDTGLYIGINRNYGAMRNLAVVYCKSGVQNNAYDWRISDCDFGNCTTSCYWQFMGGATHISGTNIYMSGDTGVVISPLANAPCMISGCYIDTHAKHGIYVEGDLSPGLRHIISGNIFRDNSSSSDGSFAHVYAKRILGAVLSGNTFIATRDVTAGFLVYAEEAENIVWNASYQASGPQRPYRQAVVNNPASLISGA